MSFDVRFKSVVTDAATLERACRRLTAANLPTTCRSNGSHRLVRLPRWSGELDFYCDRSGEVYHDSDYGGPEEMVDRLQQEYSMVIIEREAMEMGGVISSSVLDPVSGLMRVQIEMPEEVALA